MLDTYIKATGGMLGWLFFMVLNLLSPFIKGICLLFTIGGGLGFLLMGWSWMGAVSKHASIYATSANSAMPLSHEFLTFTCLGMALAGISGLWFYDIKMERMLIDRLYPAEEQGGDISRWVRVRNWFCMLALFVALSFAAQYLYPKLPMFAWPGIGFFWWLVGGVVLGVCRLSYRQGVGAFGVLAAKLRGAWGVVARFGPKARLAVVPRKAKAPMTDKEMRAAAKAFVDANKVVQFRKKG